MEDAVPPPRSKHDAKATILIVEDHFMTRWSAAEYLRMRGYKVLEAVNATEALGLASAGAPIDAVFSWTCSWGVKQSGHEPSRSVVR